MTDPSHRSANFFERKILVWTGRYASEAEIPSVVPFRTMVRAKDRARIYLAGIMGVFTAGAFLFTALSSKKLANQGNSVFEMNKHWHEQFNKTGQMARVEDLPKDYHARETK